MTILNRLLRLNPHGGILVVQLSHLYFQLHNASNTDLTGIDETGGQILELCMCQHTVVLLDTLRMDLLLKGNLPLNHLRHGFLRGGIQNLILQFASYVYLIRDRTDFLQNHFSHITDQHGCIRFCIRNVAVFFQRELKLILIACPIHVDIAL